MTRPYDLVRFVSPGDADVPTVSTYISVAGPQQLLGDIERERRDDRGHRLPAWWREELTTQLQDLWLALRPNLVASGSQSVVPVCDMLTVQCLCANHAQGAVPEDPEFKARSDRMRDVGWL